jgi:hypothetical protein
MFNPAVLSQTDKLISDFRTAAEELDSFNKLKGQLADDGSGFNEDDPSFDETDYLNNLNHHSLARAALAYLVRYHPEALKLVTVEALDMVEVACVEELEEAADSGEGESDDE